MNNILSYIDNAGSIIIAGHTRPDGDCVGSCMGMYHYIKDNYPGKRIDVRLEPIAESYRQIPGTEVIRSDYEDDTVYDLFIALDSSDKQRLAGAVKYFDTAKMTICIDHHISNKGFAMDNHIVPNASSASEILGLLMDMDKISYNTAFALYVGIICDSGVFKYDSTSAKTMTLAGMLMEKGIPFTRLIDGIFYQKTFLQNQVLSKCLAGSYRCLDDKMIVSLADRNMMDNLGACHDDLEGVIDQLRLTKDVEVALLASENADGTWKFSLRSCEYVNVSKIAQTFGGGGHVRAAGFTTDHKYGTFEEILTKVKSMVKEQL